MLFRKISRLSKNAPCANLGRARTQLTLSFCFFMVLFSTNVIAAGNTLTPGDSNSRITVENAVIDGNETTVFFFTWPYLGDPGSGKPCSLNYYSVTLKPGLPSANADVVAKGVCGGLFQKSRLLDNGDALIIVRDRLERWRGGEKINSLTFSSIDAVSKLGVTTDMMGGQFYSISQNGDIVLLIQSGGQGYDRDEYRGSSMVMSGLKPDGSRRWEEKFSGDPTLNTVEQIWAAPDGSALLHLSFLASGLASVASQLHFISVDGSRKSIEINKIEEPLDIQSMSNMSSEDTQKFFEQQRNSKPESIKKLSAFARADGGFDVLFYRKGGEEGREGHFLYHIGSDGSLISEISLANQIEDHGLENWFDFYVSGNNVVLLSRVFATQHGVQAKRKGWSQNVVSWIDLDTGAPTSRLIPLDTRYLEAAMNAGDAGMQYLDGLPGGEPALLTVLGGVPLVVSVGMVSKRPALRFNEATDQLMGYTEAYEKKQAKLAKEESRKQRKASKEARKQHLPSQPAATPQDPNTQMAVAMAELQQKIANDPNMTPQMRAQMSAIMSHLSQGSGGQYTTSPGSPPAQPQTAPTASNKETAPSPGNTLKLDTNMQGFLEFDHEDGRAMTLLIFNRQTDAELIKKDYPDGVIYEHIDFSRFKLPLQNIGVIYREVDGKILKDLTPVVAQ